ncbi:MAG: saccharopine dehydrogenase [Chlorobi bacterium]|nr:saccharopine dehydrogenase [Chlorobiota bacterium]
MKRILVIGAGLSTPSLIKYLLDQSEQQNWKVVVGDFSKEMAEKRVDGHPNGDAIQFDVMNDVQRAEETKKSDIVISMLPARLHHLMAKCCIRFSKDMVTASYVSPEVKEFHKEAKEKGIVLLNEIGLDPGIDHMSAMEVIDRLKGKGGKLTAFRSYTGGLVAPKYDNNPWNYKFTWNPRNVVLAGQGGAQFIHNGMYKHIPYHKVFSRVQQLHVNGYGEFEGYPNRDSLKYRGEYGIDDIPTMFRGTIRRPGYSKTWEALVQLGVTDDSYVLENSENLTYRDFVNSFLKYERVIPVEKKLADYVGFAEDSFEMYKLRWLGLFDDTKIGLKNATPAQILQKILEEKWQLDSDDKDMIVMQHKFEYVIDGGKKEITSSMVVEGKDNVHTAMAQTVGLPVGIAAKLLLTDVINPTGVRMPTAKRIYDPVLKELEEYGIKFTEKEREIPMNGNGNGNGTENGNGQY